MRVIVYINEPGDLQNAQACLKWALSEPAMNTGGAMHHDDKTSFFEKRKSGTVVIHVQPSRVLA